MKLSLITPEREVLALDGVSGVTLPTAGGELTVLTDHVPLVAPLKAGMVTVHRATSPHEEYLAVSGGFVEIQPGGDVRLLADTAERAEELDLAVLEEAKRKAEQAIKDGVHAGAMASAAAAATLERELSRIRVAHKHRSRRR